MKLRVILSLLLAGGFLLGQGTTETQSSADALYQFGLASLKEGKYEDAEQAFRKLYEREPANARGLMGIVEVYMAQKREDEAVRWLQTEAARNPLRLDFSLVLGNVAVRAGKYDLALAAFQKVLDNIDKRTKAAGEVYLRVGETYRRKGDPNSSIAALEQARTLLPDNPMVHNTLAITLADAGRKEQARMAYEAALKLDANNAAAWNNLAFLMAEQGVDLDAALANAQRALRLLPDSTDVADTVGWVYLKKNMADEAGKIFHDLILKEPLRATFHYHMAMAMQQKGQNPAAMEELQAALKCKPPPEEEQKIKDLMQKIGR
jgi:tetratricopeptide (TPR) repeat protein